THDLHHSTPLNARQYFFANGTNSALRPNSAKVLSGTSPVVVSQKSPMRVLNKFILPRFDPLFSVSRAPWSLTSSINTDNAAKPSDSTNCDTFLPVPIERET